MSDGQLKIAIQKSGKLAEGSFELLKQCGFHLKLAKSQYLLREEQFGIDFILVRDDDIPELVENKICDLGIVGENVFNEYLYAKSTPTSTEVVEKLGFSRCRLSIAVPFDASYTGITCLKDTTIATSYPKTLERFLQDQNLSAKVVSMHGSVELAPKIGVADVICDLVSSGATLVENRLRELVQVMESQAILIRSFGPEATLKQQKLDRLLMRIRGAKHAAKTKYITLHLKRSALPQMKALLPGCESPTVIALHDEDDRVAVHAVSQEDIFWDTMENLKSIGATSILVMPIEKMME